MYLLYFSSKVPGTYFCFSRRFMSMIMNLKKKHKKIEKLKNINTYQGFLVSPPKIKLPYIPKELLTQTVTKVDKHLLNIYYSWIPLHHIFLVLPLAVWYQSKPELNMAMIVNSKLSFSGPVNTMHCYLVESIKNRQQKWYILSYNHISTFDKCP